MSILDTARSSEIEVVIDRGNTDPPQLERCFRIMRVWVIAKAVVLFGMLGIFAPAAWSQSDSSTRLKLADGLFFDRLGSGNHKVQNDLPKAVAMYQELYEQGYIGAASRLAIAYLFGRGTDEDIEKGKKYLALRDPKLIDLLMTQLTIQINIPDGKPVGDATAAGRSAADYYSARQTSWGLFMYAYVKLFIEPEDGNTSDLSNLFTLVEDLAKERKDPNLYYVSGLHAFIKGHHKKAVGHFLDAVNLYRKSGDKVLGRSAIAYLVFAKLKDDYTSLSEEELKTFPEASAWLDSRAGQVLLCDAMTMANRIGDAYGWFLLATRSHGITLWEPFDDYVASYIARFETELLPKLTTQDKAEGEAFAKKFRDEHPIW